MMAEQEPSIAILGLGYLGRPLAERCYQAGWQVTALKHRLSSDDVNLPITVQTADFNERAAYRWMFQEEWQRAKTWVCLLPASPFAEYAECLAAWCRLAEEYGVRHLIYSSSVSVYGDECRRCDENSPLQPDSDSARKVAAAEQVFLQTAVPNIDILRLGGLYSVARHPLYRLSQRGGQAGSGDKPVNMLHQERAVAALWRAIQTPDGIRIRNVVERPHLSRAQFYHAEAAKLGIAAPDFSSDGAGGKTVYSCYDDVYCHGNEKQ